MPPEAKEKHDHNSLNFPNGFLWGAATSAHQVEGNNYFNDWWDYETKRFPPSRRSGKAADQYHQYPEDFELAKNLNHNAHRLSIEWSRIEPSEGHFNQTEIDHYKKVLKGLKDRDMVVMLTLWHFTLPKWVADQGGWKNDQTCFYFNRFLERIIPEIKELVDFWITVNEPSLYVYMSYLGGDDAGRWPPAKKNKLSAVKVLWNISRAHKKAYQTIHKLIPSAKVGSADNISSFEATHKHSVLEQLYVALTDFLANHLFFTLTKGSHDFLGINYYFNRRLGNPSLSPKIISPTDQKREVSDLGWEVYPEGIFEVLADLSDHIPIYITECGIASTNDDRRTRFLISYLQEIYRAIESGVNVRGFIYWSLIDNFEWHRGFTPRFGLIDVNYKTERRYPRPSALVYAEIIKQNGIPHKMLKLLGHTLNVKKELKEITKKNH